MSDMFLSSKNTKQTQDQGLGTNQTYVWGEGTNDIILGGNGDFSTVSDLSKLQQDIIKSLMTDRFKSKIYPIYGSSLRVDVLGQKANLEFMKAKARSAVVEALAILQFLNKNNKNSDEQIATINSVSVNNQDPRELDISVEITTKSGKILGTKVTYQ